jgi:hypothetical protein
MSQGVGNSCRFLGKPYNAATCEFDAMQTTVSKAIGLSRRPKTPAAQYVHLQPIAALYEETSSRTKFVSTPR